MEPKGFHRKLTAILSADVAGYSLMMQNDEATTVQPHPARAPVGRHHHDRGASESVIDSENL